MTDPHDTATAELNLIRCESTRLDCPAVFDLDHSHPWPMPDARPWEPVDQAVLARVWERIKRGIAG